MRSVEQKAGQGTAGDQGVASCWGGGGSGCCQRRAEHRGLQNPGSGGRQGVGLGAHCQWVLVEGLGEEPAGSMGAVTPLTREEGAAGSVAPVLGAQLVRARAEPTRETAFPSTLLFAVGSVGRGGGCS